MADNTVTQTIGPHNEWTVELTWSEHGPTHGGPSSLTIRPTSPDSCPLGGLSSTLLREIDFREALDTLRTQLAEANETARQLDNGHHWTSQLAQLANDGRITEHYLAVLARVYVDAANHGQTGPLDYLAGITGKTPAAVRNHLWQATRKGFLVRHSGRAGGTVTEKSRQVLDFDGS